MGLNGISEYTPKCLNDACAYGCDKAIEWLQLFYSYVEPAVNWIYPVNHITAEREFWYLPIWVEVLLGNALYPGNCVSQGGKTTHYDWQKLTERVGEALAPHAQCKNRTFDYEFTVIKSNQVNAWAMPGGKIAIYDKLIADMNSTTIAEFEDITLEQKIAAVLSHEVAHAAIGHTRKRLEKTFLIQLTLWVGEAVCRSHLSRREEAARTKATRIRESKERETHVREAEKYQSYLKLVDFAFNFFADVAFKLYMLFSSRNHEYEADKYGMHLMKTAGYDPRAALWLQHFFMRQKVGSLHATGGWTGKVVEWFSTHPSSKNRLAENEKTLLQLQG